MAKRILRQVLLGISFLHSLGVIHGVFLALSLVSCTEEVVEHETITNASIMSVTN